MNLVQIGVIICGGGLDELPFIIEAMNKGCVVIATATHYEICIEKFFIDMAMI